MLNNVFILRRYTLQYLGTKYHMYGVEGRKSEYGKMLTIVQSRWRVYMGIHCTGFFFNFFWMFEIFQSIKSRTKKNCLETSLYQEKEFSGGKPRSPYQRRNFKGEIKQNEG